MSNGSFQLLCGVGMPIIPIRKTLVFIYSKNSKVKFAGENATNYSNPQFDALFDKMKLCQILLKEKK